MVKHNPEKSWATPVEDTTPLAMDKKVWSQTVDPDLATLVEKKSKENSEWPTKDKNNPRSR